MLGTGIVVPGASQLDRGLVILSNRDRQFNVLGPVPGVDVVAKRSQELLNVRTLSARTLGCFRAHLREQRGGRFTRLQGDALGGPGPAWVQLGPPLAGGAPAGKLTAASSTTGTSKRG